MFKERMVASRELVKSLSVIGVVDEMIRRQLNYQRTQVRRVLS